MALPEILAKRTESATPFETTWKPIDLYGQAEEGEELVVRTKLVRDKRSAAACISEAVAHHVLASLDLVVADAYAVVIGPEFAAAITAQFEFDAPVIPGRHWGTKVIADALPTVLRDEHYRDLRRPLD